MVYLCAYKYESIDLLGIMFQQNSPPKFPAPEVECVLFAEFSDDETKQQNFIKYLNRTYPGNGRNQFNISLENLEQLLELSNINRPQQQQQQQQQQQKQQQQQQYMPISGYIVSQPTRNDDSEYSRMPVSSFSFANHVVELPKIQHNAELSFGRPALQPPNLEQYNFKMPSRQSNL